MDEYNIQRHRQSASEHRRCDRYEQVDALSVRKGDVVDIEPIVLAIEPGRHLDAVLRGRPVGRE